MRLIDADRLFSESMLKLASPGELEVVIGVRKEEIDAQPTIDAEPVKNGKWIQIHPFEKFICSECKCQSDYKWNFCPICGAKMENI